ncbi:hypothetical protein PR202_ga03439 [Eleusine coracana subsp. coracana]|uniref:O-methyltransferase domain-containing protein n=1 Tax=Eleusine coracana subsp. coracana TaxID=191504 RepID=A0AAV5BM42_ELECO|nr:hypothetical protein PR202_ga03439 [Eleusine coracana subsp. coracana]
MMAVPMALNAVIRLGVPEAIWAAGANAPLSAAELLPAGHPDPTVLERLLRLLASRGVFSEHGGSPRRYALTAVGSHPGGHGALGRVLRRLRAAAPPGRAGGGLAAPPRGRARPCRSRAIRASPRRRPGLRLLRQGQPFMEALLDGYAGGFDGVATLVDVGGSSGACLQMIMRRIGTNQGGHQLRPAGRVSHVGGDMFKSIPSGDAIFMKWVLTTWTNDECTAILKNCYTALPDGGKVIACEPVMPDQTDSSVRTRALLENDIFVMTTYRTQGRERSEEEFRQLGLAAGFSGFKAIYLDPFYAVLEYKK